jgi:dTDP-4-dehydrorhamnose reductase
VDAYTPVNEPLTTARFSGLYGHWYPHGRDDRVFARALLTQCRAVVLAMLAVRRVRPDARLVQTDDLGQTHAPPPLAYQADFENERRWLTWDLLSGRVDRHHPVWGYLCGAGVPERDLGWFRDNPCPPDVLGVNYYVTSERYLDDRLDRYPAHRHGGNGRHAYADVEAVRVLAGGPAGPYRLLRQAWERYRRPVAVTEAHLGCTREEQVRWLWEVWRAACRLRAEGADVRAVTTWSAFGAYDWDTLVTRPSGHYEPGAFDVRSDPPRPTAVARLVRDLAAGREPDHPALDSPGWWRRPDRLLFPDIVAAPQLGSVGRPGRPRVLLIAGGAGTLGRAFARVCRLRGLPAVRLGRRELDVADPKSVVVALERFRPWAVVNAAGFPRVDDAEADPARCARENAYGPAVLALACAARGAKLVTFSSDQVFDGRAARPYREADPVAPLSVFGRSKVEAERRVLAVCPGALVVRAAACFGPWDERNFVSEAIRALRGGAVFAAADDLTTTPSYLPDVVNAALDLLVDGEAGIWHLSGPDPVTWADFAREAAGRAGLDPTGVVGRPAAALGWRAPRPAYSALGSARGPLLRPLADALARYLTEFDPRPVV